MEELKKLLEVAKSAALIGGEVLKENFGKVKKAQIEEKGEKDFVSYVDRTSEERIKELILKFFPDHSVVGEEWGEEGRESPYRWFVDPLDGTKNYINGFPIFAVSVGLLYEGRPLVGAVYLPYYDHLYWAAEGLGAFKNGERIRVRNNDSLKHAGVVYGFPSRSRRDIGIYLQVFKEVFYEVGSMRRPGAAAVDICMVAEGIFDGMMEFEMKPWDVAAGLVILKEAGGKYTLLGNLSESIDVIAGNPPIHDYILSVVEKRLKEAEVG
ncbi:MAG: inositol monophosphatase [Aquificae bacterium]|nr:inositol monophosphatase [Aquificota bacterium]